MKRMLPKDRRKQSIYFAEATLAEMRHQADRLDRSLSWIAQEAWRNARGELLAMPGANDGPQSRALAPSAADPKTP